MHKTLMGLIMFIGMISLIVGGFYAASYQVINVVPNQAGTGTGDNTFTLVTGQGLDIGASIPTCEWARDIDIPVLGGLIWGSGCISSYIGFLFSFIFIQTNILWLQIVFTGAMIVIGYIIVRLLRGGG